MRTPLQSLRLRFKPQGDASTNARLDAMIAARARPSSFPFVSGDGFRAVADLICDETGLYGGLRESGVAFCATRYAELLIEHVERHELRWLAKSMTVIVHNGDVNPTVSEYSALQASFGRVMSANVTAELEALGVHALPIGIENLHWQKNGLLEYFDGLAQRFQQVPADQRETQILACFRAQTNPAEREPLKARALAAGALWLEPSPDCARYYTHVRNATFVLSPPGNGPDCHRTWEAIYLGAIPVIRRGTVSPSIVDSLPVLQVDDWQELLGLGESERTALASSLVDRSSISAYMPYWCRQL